MPTHAEIRRMPYSAAEMYALIADVRAYPEFLPWCSGARIRTRLPQPDGSEIIEADLVISFKVFRERFGSRVTLRPGPHNTSEQKIDVAYLDGPFRYLNNHSRRPCKRSSGWSSTRPCAASCAPSRTAPGSFTASGAFRVLSYLMESSMRL
jgi:ribosome-associated toxin RatA of RatAB toxin-antitoxin module